MSRLAREIAQEVHRLRGGGGTKARNDVQTVLNAARRVSDRVRKAYTALEGVARVARSNPDLKAVARKLQTAGNNADMSLLERAIHDLENMK